MERILVTGAAGYIGSVLVRLLLRKGYQVRAFDALNFGYESLLELDTQAGFEFMKGDIRRPADVERSIVDVDAVVHLAAIVGDPACAKDPKNAEGTNWHGSKLLFDFCHKSERVMRFIFASTCSNYGKMTAQGYVNEDSPLKPVSLYAELKVRFEEYLLNSQARENFAPTALRFATVYGLSPRMRFDLTVNEFIRDAVCKNEITIFGEQFWRPYCHVSDLARSCMMVLESGKEKVGHKVFNVGATEENYTKRMIAEEIRAILPEVNIHFVKKEEDPRDYRVDFSRVRENLGFEITKSVPFGLREIYAPLRAAFFENPFSQKYRNS